MLASAGFRDDAGLAHALGEQDLADAIVDLVRTGVVQLFALEIDLGAAEMFGEAFSEIERARAADIMGAEIGQFFLKGRIVLRLVPLFLQIEDQRHQRFGNEASAENAETSVLIRAGAEGIGFGCIVHALAPLALFAFAAATHRRTRRSLQDP